jgi:hypothetical protein
MQTYEWMNYIYGLNRRDDSNRCRTGRYVHEASPGPAHGWDMIKKFGWTSEYGPGLGEPYTMKQIRDEVGRIKRRLARDPDAPYEIVKMGLDVWSLVPVKGKR